MACGKKCGCGGLMADCFDDEPEAPPLPAEVEKLRDEMADTYSNPDNLPENLMSQEYYKNYFNDKRAYKKGFDTAVEKLYRPALAELKEWKDISMKGHHVTLDYESKKRERIAELEALAKQMAEALKQILNTKHDKSEWLARRLLAERALDAYKRGINE